ncbi:MAG: flagellar brake protein [Chloroflexota bacterium]
MSMRLNASEHRGRFVDNGQAILLGSGPEQARRWYQTMVRRVDTHLIWVDGAPEDQPAVRVQPGEDVTCRTWRHMDALYHMNARVAFVQVTPEPLVGLKVQAVERIQNRAYVRVPCSTEARGRHLGPASPTRTSPVREVRVNLHDLSAGGLRGRASHPVSPGDELEIELSLPSAGRSNAATLLRGRDQQASLNASPEPLTLRARVVRLIGTPSAKDAAACEIGAAFLDASKAAQERIIRFTLDVQREHRRRGLL